MSLKINNKLESFSYENTNNQIILNSKKKAQILKPQIYNEKGYKDIMQKKNTFKNSLLSSHNNFCSINHNIISTNENNSNNYNNQSKDNIYQKNNIHIESSINIGNIIPNNNEVNNIHKISNLSEDNSDDISEMSFGVGGASKNEASKKIDANRKSNNLRSKRALNNNFVSSCSVDNKINYTNKKLDKKEGKSYITPLKRNDKSNVNKSSKRSYAKNISHEKNCLNNQKIKNINNIGKKLIKLIRV
jgi:hypothetical protein